MNFENLERAFRRADPRLMPVAYLNAYCAWRFGWKPNAIKRAVREAICR